MSGESREHYIQRTVKQVEAYEEVHIWGADQRDLSAYLEIADRSDANCHYVKNENGRSTYHVTIKQDK